jgi:hypothetical protein
LKRKQSILVDSQGCQTHFSTSCHAKSPIELKDNSSVLEVYINVGMQTFYLWGHSPERELHEIDRGGYVRFVEVEIRLP